MRTIFVAIAGAAAALGLTISAASAAPLGSLGGGAFPQANLIQKTHGWHRYCDHGPVRFHRHVPGVGNVPCGRRPVYRPYGHYHGPAVIVRPGPHRYYGPRRGFRYDHRRWR